MCAGCIEFEEMVVSSAAEDTKPAPPAGIKREGNASQWSGKQSRRTTSLLNLFMPNSQGTSSHVICLCFFYLLTPLSSTHFMFPPFSSSCFFLLTCFILCLPTCTNDVLNVGRECCKECSLVVLLTRLYVFIMFSFIL